MADPVTLTAISMGASAAGAGMGFLGADRSAKAKRDMYLYQSGMAKVNAEIHGQNANFAQQQGEKEVIQSGMKSAAIMGKIRAAQGASGIDVNSGTNVDVQDSANKVARMDQDTIRTNVNQRVRSHRNAALGEQMQSGMYDFAAKNAKTEGDIGKVTSIIGGVSSVSSKWLQGRPVGIYS